MQKQALFIDRDGVINHMVHYDNGWDSPQATGDVKLIKGTEKIISWANKNNISVIEISNQPGVAKGKMSQKASDAIEKKIHYLLKKNLVIIDKVYTCPHHPKAIIPRLKRNCICRKPKPGLLLGAARDLKINLDKSIFLGDKASDAAAGKAAGVKTIIFLHNEDKTEKVLEAQNSNPEYKASSIKEAFQIIKNYFKLA